MTVNLKLQLKNSATRAGLALLLTGALAGLGACAAAPFPAGTSSDDAAVGVSSTEEQTQGYTLYNDSAATLVFTSVSGKVAAPPVSSNQVLPGQAVNFQMPVNGGETNTGDAYYNLVDNDGVVHSTVDVSMTVSQPGAGISMTTKFDTGVFTYTSGYVGSQMKNTIMDAADSPNATQNYDAGSEAERVALQTVCAQNQANCTFTLTTDQKQTSRKVLLASAYNGGGGANEPTTLTANNGFSATTTDTWQEQVSATANIADVVNLGIQVSHESSLAYTHDYSTSYSITVDAGNTGYIYTEIPTIETTGTFVVKLGNTTWTMPNVTIYSPDPTRTADNYSSDQKPGDNPLPPTLGSHNQGVLTPGSNPSATKPLIHPHHPSD